MAKKAVSPQLLLGFARDKDIKALMELLGMLCKVDGAVAARQIAEIERFMSGQIPGSRRDLAISSFRSGKDVAFNKGTVTARAFVLYGYQDGQEAERWLEPLQVLDILFRVAFADGDFSDSEDYLIDGARATLGVHKRSYWTLRDTLAERLGVQIARDGKSFAEQPQASSQSTNDNASRREPIRKKVPDRREALTALRLGDDATIREIKSTYRALVKRLHPDVLSSTSSDTVLREAVQKFCEIQEAYEALSGEAAVSELEA